MAWRSSKCTGWIKASGVRFESDSAERNDQQIRAERAADRHFRRADLRHGEFQILQRLTELHQPDTFHV